MSGVEHSEPGEHQFYCGDGVYVSVENGMVKLYTHDGFGTTNRVYIEPEVLRALGHWLKERGISL